MFLISDVKGDTVDDCFHCVAYLTKLMRAEGVEL